MSVSTSTQPNGAPLPPNAPPPPPAQSGTVTASYPPPMATNAPVAATAAAATAAYHGYYQQYYQYMYSTMYSNPAAMMQYYQQANGAAAATTPNAVAAAAAMQSYYNYNTSVPPPNLPKLSVAADAEPIKPATPPATEQVKQPAIKFNLKFQQQQQQSPSSSKPEGEIKPTVKKSRFSLTGPDAVSNVANEQTRFKQEQDATKPAPAAPAAPTVEEPAKPESATPASQPDIVYDINKWPMALKTFCAKVYHHYQAITLVSEDQVTKYLQKRITDAFKQNPNLDVGWDAEPIPDIISIRKVAPSSNQPKLNQQPKQVNNIVQKRQQQLQQQAQQKLQHQQKLQELNLLNKPASSSSSSPAGAKSSAPTSLMSSIKENLGKKRKSRSSSSSSSSSSRSSSSSSSSSSSPSSKSSSSTSSWSSTPDRKKPSPSKRSTTNNNSIDSENFISLSNSVRNRFGNNNQFNKNKNFNQKGANQLPANFDKLSKKQQKRILNNLKRQGRTIDSSDLVKSTSVTTTFNNSLLISRKFNQNNNHSNDNVPSLVNVRKKFKSIFELERVSSILFYLSFYPNIIFYWQKIAFYSLNGYNLC